MKRTEIRGESVDFPIAVTGWIEAAAPVDFPRLGARRPVVALGAAGVRFRERPLGRRRRRMPLRGGVGGHATGGGFWRFLVGRHTQSLGAGWPAPQVFGGRLSLAARDPCEETP